jgi:hemoglobin
MEDRPSVFEFAGGSAAFLALAEALHERCVADPVLNHPFSHGTQPDHLEHLGGYLGEVFGGPPVYSEGPGGHSVMLAMHASTGADDDMAHRFLACFDQAVDDAGLPEDPAFRTVLHDYMAWATGEVNEYSPLGSVVPDGLAFPRWSWDGPVQ